MALRRILLWALTWALGLALAHGQTPAQPAKPASSNDPSDKPRIILDIKVNGQPVHLDFDTGAVVTNLFRPVVERLGLKIAEPAADIKPPLGQVNFAVTETCEISILGTTIKGEFAVADVPAWIHPDTDGSLAWSSLTNAIVLLDWSHLKCVFGDALPPGMNSWLRLPISPDFKILVLDISQPDGKKGKILVDTGSSGGVSLPPAQWHDWRAAHPDAPVTLDAYYMSGAGLVVAEECWADELTIGPLHLTHVPVRSANSTEMAFGGSDFAASLGLYALSRLTLALDGPNKMAYAQLNDYSPQPYLHNRLGAVFAGSDPNTDPQIAHVIKGSPADTAGIRDGDILLRIGDLDVTKWRTDPTVLPLARFWQRPAGTKLELTLRRDGKEFHATPVLRDLLGPGSDSFRNQVR